MARSTGPRGSSTAANETRFAGNTAGDPAPDDPKVNDTRLDSAPQGTDKKPTVGGTLKRTLTEFSEDNLTDWAAALTYYGILSIFPALFVFVSVP